MSETLNQSKQRFLDKRQQDILNAAQSVALQLSCGLDLHQTLEADEPIKVNIIRRLDRMIQRERLKGLGKHWSYDINRHIALKQVRDRLMNMVSLCQK